MVIIVSRWSDVISLISITEGKDADGFPINVEIVRDNIFASRLPVHSTEFYSASKEGYIISKVFKIRAIDFEGEESLVHENERYRIKRPYDKGEFIELSCERRDDSFE